MPSPFDQLLPRYDAVVIGAGLGGMTAANNLAKFGRKVLLLEHHYQLGGLATYFKRAGGHVFDISLHGFPHGMIKSTRRYWTKEISDRIHQLHDVRFINPDFDVRTTFDRADFTRILVERFRLPAATVEAFFSYSTLPVSSSTTSTDCDPKGTARAAALEIVISTAARNFLIR